MNRILFLILFFSFHTVVQAQTYTVVDAASKVKFTIKNVGMPTDGTMTGLSGEIRFNPSDLKNALFDVSIDANTVNTDIAVRDSSLKTAEYLNTHMYPEIRFLSKQITAGNSAGTYLVKGTLTIKGISKEITVPFTVSNKNDGLLFAGDMRVNRMDFKIAPGSIVLSNTLVVSLSVFAKKG